MVTTSAILRPRPAWLSFNNVSSGPVTKPLMPKLPSLLV
jgi:hypothetical protein